MSEGFPVRHRHRSPRHLLAMGPEPNSQDNLKHRHSDGIWLIVALAVVFRHLWAYRDLVRSRQHLTLGDTKLFSNLFLGQMSSFF